MRPGSRGRSDLLPPRALRPGRWWSVVPSARRTLAREKRAGPLRKYLEDIQSDEGRAAERWFYTDWLRKLERQQEMAARGAARRASAAASAAAAVAGTEQQASTREPGAAAEQQQQQQQQQQAEVEEYVDREPTFFSLDNPLLATAALIAAFGALSALVRAASGV
jgi:cobalamin biosynthesis Mg chelatase CobN